MHLDKITELIQTYDKIIIHRHVRPDPDALGSQGALKEIIQYSFPDKKVYAVGTDDPAYSFLAKMDKISDDTFKEALIIVCDTANTERIDDQRYTLGDKIIKIDHHPNVDPYGDIRWVDTTSSSTCELIYEWFLHAKSHGFRMTKNAARLLYAGIVGDTGRFLFPSTTAKTFTYATELIQYDFDRQALYDGLYRVGENIARLKGHILQNFTKNETGASFVKLTKDDLEYFGVTALETSQIVGTLGDIDGILAWAIFVEEEEQIRVRLRSKGPVINKIAAKYNGGGHPLASGASIYKWEEVSYVKEDIEKACQQYKEEVKQ